MSLNGSGQAQINSTGQPVVGNTTISSTVFNAFTADVATMLSTCVMKDGQQTITADLPMNNHKLTGMAAGTARTDSATLANVQDGTGVYVATVGGTADAITLSPSPAIAAYAAGQQFWFLASGANTGATTIAVSGLSAKAVRKNGTTVLAANDLLSGAMIGVEYDGTNFQLLGIGQSIIGTIASAQNDILQLQINIISKTTIDAKGDLLVGTADDTIGRQSIGTNGQVLVADSAQTNGLKWADPATAVSFMGSILNGTLTVTMAANAVTVALKTLAGSDPSASDPVSIVFRSATATTGNYAVRSVTAALSVVISSGSSLGTLNNTLSRIYVGALDNAGTVELCVWNPVNTSGLFSVSESDLISTTAEGGAGAADSAHVPYSTTARSNVYARYLGYFESTQVTAGTWASAATKIQLMGPGVRRTGDTVQIRQTATGEMATGTTNMPDDDTIPQNTEGDQYMSHTIVPTASVNLIEITHQGMYSTTSGSNYGVALFQDSTANALASVYSLIAANTPETLSLYHLRSAGSTSTVTYKIRAGGQSVGTTTFNGLGGARRHGGVLSSFLRIAEIMA